MPDSNRRTSATLRDRLSHRNVRLTNHPPALSQMSRWRDLNPRPPGPRPGALHRLSYTQKLDPPSGDRAAPIKAAGPGPKTNLVERNRIFTGAQRGRLYDLHGIGSPATDDQFRYTLHKVWWARRDLNSHSLRRRIYSPVGSNPCQPAHLQLGLVRRFHVPSSGGHSGAASHSNLVRRGRLELPKTGL